MPIRRLRQTIMAVHIALTAVMGWWCFVLLLPYPTFAAAPVYEWFTRHWPRTELGWSAMFACATLCGISGPFVRNRWARLLFVTLLAAAHGAIAQVLLQSDLEHGVITTGPGAYAIFALLGLWRVWAEGWV